MTALALDDAAEEKTRMEESLAALLASCEESEFLRVTSTALKIIQNIQNEPSEERFRRIRRTAPVSPTSCKLERFSEIHVNGEREEIWKNARDLTILHLPYTFTNRSRSL